MQCPKCDTNNPADSKYCKECATSLTGDGVVQPSITKTIETPKEELTTGSTFAGRYQIIEELGSGGMGKVYKAVDTRINEKIALKLIKPEISSDKKTLERFGNELKLARKIAHKNVGKMFDINEEQGTHYITMEYVSGQDLKGLIRQSGQLAIGTSLSITKQICEGLLEAHKVGVIHRDLKPNNIMIDRDGQIRILDFGIARSLKEKGITGAGVMIGTPEYMSPEQAEAKEVDQRSDLYSLGVILYEMVTGKVPFAGDTALSIAMKHKGESPQDPKEHNPQMPADLNTLILKCLEKDKNNRYQGAEELYSELENIEKAIPTSDRAIPKRKPLTSKEITLTFKAKRLLIPAFAVAISMVGLILWHPWSRTDTPQGQLTRPSVAVLPFEDLSPQKDQEYFCDGLVEELINRLANIENLRIPARASAFSFKNKAIDMQEIGDKLNVEMVLNGSVRKSGATLRITAELVKVSDGYPVWSKIYESTVADTFALQDEISLAIVDNLKINLLGEEKTKFEKRYTQNLEAYDLYLRGRFFWWKRNEEGLKKALEYFSQAIESDPDYALAYLGLADTYTMLDVYNIESSPELGMIRSAVQKAIEIDDKLAEAHTSLGNIKMYYDWDWDGAMEEFRIAIELNPNYLWAHLQYVDCLIWTGQFDRAFEEIVPGYELDPLNIVVNSQMAYAYYYTRRYREAEETSKKVIMMDPNFNGAYDSLGRAYMQQSRYDEAQAEFQREIENTKGYLSNSNYYYCVVLAKRGMKDEAEKRLEELITSSEEMYLSPTRIAWTYVALNQKEKAFEWLARALKEHDISLRTLKIDPLFDSLQSDSRFTELPKKIGLD